MSNTPNATASASVVFPMATALVVLLWVAKAQNLWGLGDLSWWIVFAPYWLGLAVFLGIILLFVIFAGIAFVINELVDSRRRKKRAKRRSELEKQLKDGTITPQEFRRQNNLKF